MIINKITYQREVFKFGKLAFPLLLRRNNRRAHYMYFTFIKSSTRWRRERIIEATETGIRSLSSTKIHACRVCGSRKIPGPSVMKPAGTQTQRDDNRKSKRFGDNCFHVMRGVRWTYSWMNRILVREISDHSEHWRATTTRTSVSAERPRDCRPTVVSKSEQEKKKLCAQTARQETDGTGSFIARALLTILSYCELLRTLWTVLYLLEKTAFNCVLLHCLYHILNLSCFI